MTTRRVVRMFDEYAEYEDILVVGLLHSHWSYDSNRVWKDMYSWGTLKALS